MALSLEQLNAATQVEFVRLLDGTYESSPWVAERAWPKRPFRTLEQLKLALVEAVRAADREQQHALLRAHPELGGKAMIAGTLTAESTHEQGRAGLTQASADELAQYEKLSILEKEKSSPHAPQN